MTVKPKIGMVHKMTEALETRMAKKAKTPVKVSGSNNASGRKKGNGLMQDSSKKASVHKKVSGLMQDRKPQSELVLPGSKSCMAGIEVDSEQVKDLFTASQVRFMNNMFEKKIAKMKKDLEKRFDTKVQGKASEIESLKKEMARLNCISVDKSINSVRATGFRHPYVAQERFMAAVAQNPAKPSAAEEIAMEIEVPPSKPEMQVQELKAEVTRLKAALEQQKIHPSRASKFQSFANVVGGGAPAVRRPFPKAPQKAVAKDDVTENLKILKHQVLKNFQVKNLDELKERTFMDQRGNLVAKGVDDIVINDHGVYAVIDNGADFARGFINKGPSKQNYFNILKSKNDPRFQAYQQLKPTERANPPPGVFAVANNRTGGYSSYEAGKVYFSLCSILVPQPGSQYALLSLNVKETYCRLRKACPTYIGSRNWAGFKGVPR